MFTITKDFEFCYGHRVFTQELDSDLSLCMPCKCRHLHGHQGLIRITLAAKVLKNGMVTDFNHLAWFKKWLDDHFDHKMVLSIEDPLVEHLLYSLYPLPDVTPQAWDGHLMGPSAHFYTPNAKFVESQASHFCDHELELIQGLTLVPFVPTSENLAYFFKRWVEGRMSEHLTENDIAVHSVEFKETPKSSSISM